VETARIAEITKKLDISDIDWQAAAAADLTSSEQFILTYFADIESQTIMYMRDLLHTSAAKDQDVLAFLGIWNYEEYFHGFALSRLMSECGHDLGESRIANVRKAGDLSTIYEPLATWLLSRVFDEAFVCMYMAWGSTQEMTTHQGYERIIATSQNPVLVELCKRINKQERVHFSWYYNNAKKRLEASSFNRKFTRFMLKNFWSPVGAGIKHKDEVARLFEELFPGEAGDQLAHDVDEKISALPGLEGLTIMGNYLEKKVYPLYGNTARVASDTAVETTVDDADKAEKERLAA